MTLMGRRTALRAGLAATTLAGGAVLVAKPAEAAIPVTDDGWISVLAHGAVGDGVTDDTAAIQAAFDAARAATPNKGVVFPAGRTYRVSDRVTLSGLTDTALRGYGATLVLVDATPVTVKDQVRGVLQIQGCHRLKVLGLNLVDNAATYWYSGLVITASTGVVVDGVVSRGFRHTGISVWDNTPGTSNDILITNCTTEDVRLGIASNGHDVRITDNHVAMDWLSSQEAEDWGGVWRAESKYYDGINVWFGADRTVISGNTITECGQAGVYTQQVTNLVVADNTVIGCQLRAIEVDGSARGSLPRSGQAVGVSITGNVATNCIGHINVLSARDVTVVGNRVENPNASRAVSCVAVHQGSTKAVVVGNHLRQAHPSHPAIFVDIASVDVTLAWNAVEAAVPYQAPADTVIIRRSGAGQIRTEGKLIAVGGIGVGNSVAASTPGSVVRKIEVFSSTGQSLGWVPVYNSIT
ncbi:right-handed parallel beta-helix repeat-containing protein [Micromonospora sp. WMMD1155]|uniref:right-handed parallel beta-helix repeat-containing protein n=1 Tax=Micromonospora sp. WMMD1155 TaxID=3016094 RepID=UPI00249A65B7|nr:right-handed parallel beta-helix repeat-containing protein [Micromonospora sp. WMMD1155]WFE53508.1 right-handed parallel beta-helix repeat-containing protein [Micromonospora sp. WMMD1155]